MCDALTRSTTGAHGFDFLAGSWLVANRKLRDARPDQEPHWDQFPSFVESRPILGGAGNVDTYDVPDFPGRGLFHGFALRLYDAGSDLWRIWWASSIGEGKLDPPLVGGFIGDDGHFEGDDTYAGQPIRVRFRWGEITPTSARWEQSFSFDQGDTFAPNWIMEFERRDAAEHER